MGRIANIMKRVRDSLSDPSATRWTNDRLLRLLDEAQTDIAVHSNLLRTRVEIPIIADIASYNLPSKAFKLTRAVVTPNATTATTTGIVYNKIPIKSHHQMDQMIPNWETLTGDGIQYIVFDKQYPSQFKVYPIPSASDSVSEHAFLSDHGVLTASTDDTIPYPYGVVTDVTTSATLTATFSSDFGIVTDMASAVTSIIAYYNHRPETLDDYSKIDTEQTLEIDEVFDKALKHYVVGMALRDDMDTQNRTVGNEELVFYERERKLASALSETDSTAAAQHHTVYNDGFNI